MYLSLVAEYQAYGSLKRAAKVYSIEGSAAWSQKIKAYAKSHGLNNLTIDLRDSSLYPDRGKFSDEFNTFFLAM